jgi:transposase InsO family protein
VWTAQQMIEALPEDTGLRYVIRDRDAIYGTEFQRRVAGMGLTEVLIAPRSPWQNAYAERFVGSLRRECSDHVIALSERQVYHRLELCPLLQSCSNRSGPCKGRSRASECSIASEWASRRIP